MNIKRGRVCASERRCQNKYTTLGIRNAIFGIRKISVSYLMEPQKESVDFAIAYVLERGILPNLSTL